MLHERAHFLQVLEASVRWVVPTIFRWVYPWAIGGTAAERQRLGNPSAEGGWATFLSFFRFFRLYCLWMQ